RGPQHLCARRRQGRTLGPRQEARALLHARRAWPQREMTPSRYPSPLDRQNHRNRKMSGTLVLVRHGQSEWNLKNLFTGWRDVGLSEQGVAEARAPGRRLKAKGLHVGVTFTSALKRAQHTLDLMLEELGETSLPIT